MAEADQRGGVYDPGLKIVFLPSESHFLLYPEKYLSWNKRADYSFILEVKILRLTPRNVIVLISNLLEINHLY